MAQPKSRVPQQPAPIEDSEVTVPTVAPNESAMPHMRFAFGVWFAVFSLLAASILWDSIYGLLFRTTSGG
jgi:hypothetical protein